MLSRLGVPCLPLPSSAHRNWSRKRLISPPPVAALSLCRLRLPACLHSMTPAIDAKQRRGGGKWRRPSPPSAPARRSPSRLPSASAGMPAMKHGDGPRRARLAEAMEVVTTPDAAVRPISPRSTSRPLEHPLPSARGDSRLPASAAQWPCPPPPRPTGNARRKCHRPLHAIRRALEKMTRGALKHFPSCSYHARPSFPPMTGPAACPGAKRKSF